MGSEGTWRVLVCALIISLGGGFHMGYQFTVMNPSEETFTNFINNSYQSHYGLFLSRGQWAYLWPFMVNMQTIGGLLGTFLGQIIFDKLGCKKSFYVTCSIVLIACSLLGISKPTDTWEILLIGRLLLGVAQGIQLGIQPVYLNEISPKSIRGMVGSMTGFIVEFGFLLAAVLALPEILGDSKKWPYLFLIESIPSLITLSILPFLPESPKYLANKGDFNGAINSLRFYRGNNEHKIKEELQEIRNELTKSSTPSSISLTRLFRVSYIRKGVLLGLAAIIAANYSGIMALSYYSTSILKDAGLNRRTSQYAAIAITAPSCLGALIGGLVLDKFGRRPIILIATSALLILNLMFIGMAHLSRVYRIIWASYLDIGIVTSLTLCFGSGPGIFMWLLTSELVPTKVKSIANTLAMAVHWICAGTAALIFYPLQQTFYEFSFFLHVIPLTFVVVYFALALPETNNKSTVEIMRILGYRGEEEINVDGVTVVPLREEEKRKDGWKETNSQ